MQNNISPEEKLLRLIKGQKPPVLASSKALKNEPYVVAHRYLSLARIQRIVFIALIASCVYLAVVFIYPRLGFIRVELPKEPPAGKPASLKAAEAAKSYEFYLEAVKGRQVFNNVSGEVSRGSQTAVLDAGLVKDMNLMGIVSGENPQAVIEDKKTQKTYYLNKGQALGEFKIEDIQEGRVILKYKEERFELYL